MQTVGSLLRLLLLFISYWSHPSTCAPLQNNERLKRDETEDLKLRIQRDELYHHALAQGLQVLGPDPESDESLMVKEVDQGHQKKRSAKLSSNEYGDYNVNYENAEYAIGRQKRVPVKRQYGDLNGNLKLVRRKCGCKVCCRNVAKIKRLEQRMKRVEYQLKNSKSYGE